jgi:2',3'-cyclic-nucleotide 2'-phosphodiesterase (5'-nucleotidase family)
VHLYIILDGRTVQAVITALAGDRRVKSAQPNYDYQLLQQTADTAPLPQYAVDLLHLNDVHQHTTGATVRSAYSTPACRPPAMNSVRLS